MCVSEHCVFIISKHEATAGLYFISTDFFSEECRKAIVYRQRAKENHKAEIQEDTFNTTVAISKSIECTRYSGFSPIRKSK
jgi:hypothetical protein